MLLGRRETETFAIMELYVVSTNMSNTQHKARYVISVDLGRVFLSPTAMYAGKRPDGPGAPRSELFKMFVDSTDIPANH